MKKLLLILLTIFGLYSCDNGSSTNKPGKADKEFAAYTERFIEQLWEIFPEWATQVGYHKHNNILSVPDSAYQIQVLQFAQNHLDSLKVFNVDELSPSLRIDYRLIENHLNYRIWELTEQKSYCWDPSQYNIPAVIAFMLNEQFAPLDERLLQISHRLTKAKDYYTAAINNLTHTVPELAQLAIDQNQGGLSVLQHDIADSLLKSNLSEEQKQQILSLSKEATVAIEGFIEFLRKEIPLKKRSFRLGKDLYEKKFAFNIQADKTAEQLYREALKRKEYIHEKMYELAVELWPKYFGNEALPDNKLLAIRIMIDTLSVNHSRPESFQQDIEKQLPELTNFVTSHNLLYIDPTKPLVVRREPGYLTGIAGASISAPGPYDTTGNTYYNVGSLLGWPRDKAESYLREYNNYTLQILNIHEAIPGHYTQLVYANKSPSLIKSIFANDAMIEGWAVYAEQMMLENGYGNNEPEMWMMWYKWNLRTVCNTILDYSVHTNEMNREEAMDLLINQAFQQVAEAEGKWRRVNVTSVQLTAYFSGYTEIIALREELKNTLHGRFDLKAFHEQFLSYGNAPVKYIRELMLEANPSN